MLPGGANLLIPGSSLWNAFEDIFMPFGTINDWSDLPMNFLPGVMRWGIMGFGVAQTPTDEFWEGDFDRGFISAIIPVQNQSQMASQVSESMMYIEAHDVIDGRGPWARIQEKKVELQALLDSDRSDENQNLINSLESEITVDEQEWLARVKNLAAGSLFERMLIGQGLPTSPRHLREEQDIMNDYWGSREYADVLRASGGGIQNLNPFADRKQMDDFFEQVGLWLEDPTGDSMKNKFREEVPHLLPYLVPKSFWKEGGVPPQLSGFAEYQYALIRGDIQAAPLGVTVGRLQSQNIQTEFYNSIQARLGGDTPEETAANAFQNWEIYQEIIERKNEQYAALFMEDDFGGGEYREWLDSREDTSFALEQYLERDREVRANLTTLLTFEAELDEVYDLQEIQELRPVIRGALSKLSDAIEDWDIAAEDNDQFLNPFEKAINRYWKEVYEPYSERIGALYDSIEEHHDSEERSLIYEQIKLVRNEYVGTNTVFPGESGVYPSPLEIQWDRKTPEEQHNWLQKRITNPAEWLDLDAAGRIVDQAAHLAPFIPTSDHQMIAYRQWTLMKVQIDEAYEQERITSGERTKLKRQAEIELRNILTSEGRGKEILWMDMLPIERLDAAGMLPRSLGIYLPEVRWYKEALAASDKSAATQHGQELLDPLYQKVRRDALTNVQLRNDLDDIGTRLYDNTNDDVLLPMFFFGLWELQED